MNRIYWCELRVMRVTKKSRRPWVCEWNGGNKVLLCYMLLCTIKVLMNLEVLLDWVRFEGYKGWGRKINKGDKNKNNYIVLCITF